MRRYAAILAVFVGLAFSLSCAHGGHPLARPARKTVFSIQQAGFTPAQQTLIGKHCPEGLPELDPQWDHGPTHYGVHDGYVLQHSDGDRIPLWVCEGVSREQLLGDKPRKNLFKPDASLPAGKRAELSDYKGSGFDRGHQAPAGNQTVDQQLKNETFFLSNMAPQLGAFNQQAWAALEDTVRDWIFNNKVTGAKIITGGFFYDPEEDNAATADGLVEYQTIGSGVAVPTHFFKIVTGQRNGALEAIAFVMENRKYAKPYHFDQQIKSIQWLEEHSGINFMPGLSASERVRLEQSTPTIWQ